MAATEHFGGVESLEQARELVPRHSILITVQQVLLGTVTALGVRRSKDSRRATIKPRRHYSARCDVYLERSRMQREMDRL